MILGEKIYKLRTKQGLSQGDLAEHLNVSRQSISKWETGGSTPDLDKLINMSQLFGVTLDELVLDKKPETEKEMDTNYSSILSTQQADTYPQQHHETQFPARKIIGTILFCMGFLTFLILTVSFDLLNGAVLALPFFICGTICLIFRKYVGLWCSWALFCMVDLYLKSGTVISWQAAISYLRYFLRFEAPAGLVGSIIMLFLLSILMVVTILLFSKKASSLSLKNLILYFTCLAFRLLLSFSSVIVPRFYALFKYPFGYAMISWTKIALLTLLLIYTIRFLRTIYNKYHRL